MYTSRKPQYGRGWGTPRDSPGTHGELVPRAGREVSESRGRADPGHPPRGRESRGQARPGVSNGRPVSRSAIMLCFILSPWAAPSPVPDRPASLQPPPTACHRHPGAYPAAAPPRRRRRRRRRRRVRVSGSPGGGVSGYPGTWQGVSESRGRTHSGRVGVGVSPGGSPTPPRTGASVMYTSF